MKAFKAEKTNAVRLLDSLELPYELRSYAIDLDDLSAPSAARKIGLAAEQVFKTLLAVSSAGGYVFAIVPADAELDLKKLAVAAGMKRCDLAPLKDVEPLTGYLRGGVTVLAAKKVFPAFVDETIELHDVISVSAGHRGLQILLAPAAYLKASSATVCDLIRAKA